MHAEHEGRLPCIHPESAAIQRALGGGGSHRSASFADDMPHTPVSGLCLADAPSAQDAKPSMLEDELSPNDTKVAYLPSGIEVGPKKMSFLLVS